MKKYDSRNQKTFPDFATKGPAGAAAVAVRSGDGGKAEGAERPRAMLDIPTPPTRHLDAPPVRRWLNRSARRLYSRCLLGLKQPGRYYFITYTTCMTTPKPIEAYWKTLWKYLTRARPGVTSIRAFTWEGKAQGVLHLIVRLPPGAKRYDARTLRAHWKNLTGATQLKIKYVPESEKENLAAYISDQRKLKGLAGEMCWQDQIKHWRWSPGWIPKGFTRAFGRVWHRVAQSELEWLPDAVIADWIRCCAMDPDAINHPPRIMVKGGEKT